MANPFIPSERREEAESILNALYATFGSNPDTEQKINILEKELSMYPSFDCCSINISDEEFNQMALNDLEYEYLLTKGIVEDCCA